MKKLIVAFLMVIGLSTYINAEVPLSNFNCSVGRSGPLNTSGVGPATYPAACYWVYAADNKWYCLGTWDDARAKVFYATVLAAMANGKSIKIGWGAYSSLPPFDGNSVSIRSSTHPLKI